MKRALLLLTLSACTSHPAVNFAAADHYLPEEYDRVYQRWTRHAHVTHDFDTALDASVTLLSQDFRTAYVARVAASRQLSADETVRLAREQQDEAAQAVEFFLNAQTGRWDWNDFSSVRSLWTLTLVDDQGHELAQPNIQPSLLKSEARAELFPPVTPFTRSWRVRFKKPGEGPFPNTTTRWIGLRIAGPLGQTSSDELIWKSSNASAAVR